MDFNKIPKTKIKHIVWAVDPFETDVTLDLPTVQDLDKWAKENQVVIEPVYVFTPFGEIEKLATEKIANNIAKIFLKLKINTKPPHILIRPMDSTKSSAISLLSYALDSGADLIVVSSHGRRGFPRMLFGSFAETLLNTSPMPLLFMNKNSRPIGASFQHVLWATDFSKSCEFAFDTFLSQAGGLCKRITLFHDVTLPLELSLYFSQWDVGVPPMNDLIESQTLWAKQESADWIKHATQKGFKIQLATEASHGQVANEILTAAGENASGLIVMASQSGPVGSAILGSHAREIFRTSQLPVWIYGPQFCEAQKRQNKGKESQKSTVTAHEKSHRRQNETGTRAN